MSTWLLAPLSVAVIVLYLLIDPKLTRAASQPGGQMARSVQMTVRVLLVVAALLGAVIAVSWLGVLLFPGVFGGT